MKRWTLFVFLFLALALPVAAEEASPEPVRFPNLELTALDGESSVTVEDFRGRPLLITIWASWCGPCRTELPELQKLYGEIMGTGFTVVTVSVDNSPLQAQRFLERMKLRLPVYMVDRMELRKLGISAVPTSVLIDREGMAVRAWEGYYPNMTEQIKGLVEKMEREPVEKTEDTKPS